MIRKIQSKNTAITETGEFNGYVVTFNYSVADGETKPKEVRASGYKMNGSVSINFTSNQTENGYSINFPNGKVDDELETEIRSEFAKILK